MEFLGSLGIDIKLLIAQIINFGLLLWLLKKFLYKPIIKRIEKDQEELKQAKLEKSKIQKQEEAFEEQEKQEIADSKKKAKEIIEEAQNIAKGIKENAQKETEQERQAIIKQIKARLTEVENEKKSQQSK